MEGDEEPTHCVIRCSSLAHRCPKTKKAPQALDMVTSAGGEIHAGTDFANESPSRTMDCLVTAEGMLGHAMGCLEELAPLDERSFSDDDSGHGSSA